MDVGDDLRVRVEWSSACGVACGLRMMVHGCTASEGERESGVGLGAAEGVSSAEGES